MYCGWRDSTGNIATVVRCVLWRGRSDFPRLILCPGVAVSARRRATGDVSRGARVGVGGRVVCDRVRVGESAETVEIANGGDAEDAREDVRCRR